jgi:NAD(P)-dependent dehydrogenase (short-subunit alcohol dehydrogenase family)
MTDLSNRVFAVTGGGGGLGREYCRLIASLGAKVVLNDLGGARDGSGGGSEMADAVVAEIEAVGGIVAPSYDSTATKDGAQAIVNVALEKFGRIDGVVANAGILRDVSFAKMTFDAWQAVHQVHLDGAYHLVKAAWPSFRDQQFGRIVVTTSSSGIFGNFGQANYAAAKMGLIGLMNTLAIEGKRHNIHANAVSPVASTRMTADTAPEEVLAQLSPAHVAPVVAHLLGEGAGTGDVIMAGGGEVKRIRWYESEGVRFDHVPTVSEVETAWAAAMAWDSAVPARNPADKPN